MCGRYSLTQLELVLRQFDFALGNLSDPPRYNIAPTQPVLAICNDHPAQFEHLHWGLVPSWAKDASIGSRMINARAETLAEKPAFRTALRRRRCLVVADGFYEWRKEKDGSKTPMYIRLKGHEPFAFAGLWDIWHAPDGSAMKSCTLITGAPNDLVKTIHDRMVVILPRQHYQEWLATGERDPAALSEMLKPYSASEMEAYAVSRAVNSPKNEGPRCIEPVAQESGSLFDFTERDGE